MYHKTILLILISFKCFSQFAVESDLTFVNAKYVEEKFGNKYKYNYPIMYCQVNGTYKIAILKDVINVKPLIGIGFLPLNTFEKIGYAAFQGTVQKGETVFTFGLGGGAEFGKKNKCEIIYYNLFANNLWTRASETNISFYKIGYHRDIGSKYSYHLGITYSKNDFCFNDYNFNCKNESEYKKDLLSFGGYFTLTQNF